MSFRKSLLSIAVGGMLLMGAASAKANSIIVTFLGSAPAGGANEFSYDATLSQGVNPSQAQPGDFFTIYDFSGYTGVHSEPAGWTLSTNLVGTNPADIPSPGIDSATILNLTWTWGGPGNINSITDLGTFKARSTISSFGSSDYTGSDHTFQTAGPFAGTYQQEGNIGPTTVPAAVPVPASAWAGLLLLAGLATRRLTAKLNA